MSYEQLARLVQGGSEVITNMGVRAGHRVAFYSKGTLDFFVAFLSVQAAGATPVLLNWRQSKENLKGMIEDSGSTFLILGALNDNRGELMSVLPENIEALLLLDGQKPSGFRGTVHNWALREADIDFQSLPVSKVIDRSSEAAIFFTSGSTSRPKPVLHTYSSLIWTAENFVFPVSTTATLSFLPNFHVIMTLQNFLIPLARGFCISVHAADANMPITAGMLLKAAAELSPSVIDTVPFIMEEWSALSYEELEPLRQCALVQSGGAPLSTATASALLDAGVPVRQHYGQTEAPGIQLATVPGATASEMSIFMPPWKMASAVLDGGSEGELMIQGIENTALGTLAAGVLVPGSCKMEVGVGHRTGDVFRWTKTESGQVGLQHCMRVDDTLLLSTGEMFNPVPMEKSILDSCHHCEGLQGSLVAVLGKNRASSILVVELPAGCDLESRVVLQKIQPAIDTANASEVEYARIKPYRTVILGASDQKSLLRMPKTAKGNFIRSQSETLLSELLDEVEIAAKEAQANEMMEKARAAGYKDVQEFLDSAGDEHSQVDSLGVQVKEDATLSTMTRICDNAKAITMVSVLYYHFYFLTREPDISSAGNTLLFCATMIVGIARGVTETLYFLTASMWVFFFAFGTIDGIQDGPGRVLDFFSGRTYASFLILVLYKLTRGLLLLGNYAGYLADGDATIPPLMEWFIYLMLYYRAFVRLMQLFRLPKWLQVTIAAAIAGRCFFDTTVNRFYFTLPDYMWPLGLMLSWDAGITPCSICSLVEPLNPNCFETGIPGVCLHSYDGLITYWTEKYDYFALSHVLAYYWGEAALGWMVSQQHKVLIYLKSNPIRHCSEYRLRVATTICSLFAAYGAYLLLNNTACDESRQFFCASVQSTVVMALSFLIFLASVALPGHAKRMGATTLGLYVFHRYCAFLFFGWLEDVVNLIGTKFGNEHVSTTAIQLLLLMGWPVLLSYTCGPTLNWLVITPITYIRELF